jgi:hypothetical protein
VATYSTRLQELVENPARPLGRLGAGLDRAVLHHVADATIRALLRHLADALTRPATAADHQARTHGGLLPDQLRSPAHHETAAFFE